MPTRLRLASLLLALTVAPTASHAQGRYQSQGVANRHFQSGETDLARGEEARAEGDTDDANDAFRDALDDYKKAIDADPDFIDAYARLGRLYYDLDRPDDAIPVLEAGLQRSPQSDDIRFWLGQHLLRAAGGDADRERRAIELLDAVATGTDRFPEVHLVLANHAYDRAEYTRAAEQYTRYLAQRPDAIVARARLGNAYIKQERFADALTAFEAVRAAEPDNVAVLVNIGNAHLRLGQYDPAVEALQAALRRDPKRLSARFGLAQSHFESGRYDEAIPHYQQFATAAPKSFNGQYFGGSALMAAGRDDDALPRLTRAHELRPDVAQPLYKIGIIHLRNNRAAEAIPPLRDALDLRPKNPWILSALGTAARQQGRLDDALALHRKAAAEAARADGDRHAKVPANLALTALAADKIPDAEANIALALARDADDPWVLDAALSVLTAAARAQARNGDLRGARARLGRAIELRPDHPVVQADLALLEAALGDAEPALARARAAADAAPDQTTARVALARALLTTGAHQQAAQTYAALADARPGLAAAGEGAALLAAGRTDEAITRLDAAAEARPADTAIKRNRALAHLRRAAGTLDRRLEAAADVQIAVEADDLLEPIDVARAHYAALVLALRRARDREAEGHLARLDRARREAPDDARLLAPGAPARHLELLTAYVNVLRGQDERALQLLTTRRDARRGDTEAGRLLHIVHHRLGRAAATKGDLREARAHFESARKLAQSPALTHDIAVLDHLAGRRGRHADTWAALVNQVPEARFNTGVALEAQGKHREAWQAFSAAARAGGPHAKRAAEIADAKRRVFGFDAGAE